MQHSFLVHFLSVFGLRQTRPFAENAGKTPKEMGMKSTHDGASCPLHLLLAENLKGNGWFYGSDSLRSPLDRYRDPGDPEFEG